MTTTCRPGDIVASETGMKWRVVRLLPTGDVVAEHLLTRVVATFHPARLRVLEPFPHRPEEDPQ